MLRHAEQRIDVCVSVTLVDASGTGAFGFSSLDQLPSVVMLAALRWLMIVRPSSRRCLRFQSR